MLSCIWHLADFRISEIGVLTWSSSGARPKVWSCPLQGAFVHGSYRTLSS